MYKFGPLKWPDTPAAEDATEYAVPVGLNCADCKEEILPGDAGFALPHYGGADAFVWLPQHEECYIVMAIGSFNHIFGLCSCTIPGASHEDPPGITRRQANVIAVWAFMRKNRSKIST